MKTRPFKFHCCFLTATLLVLGKVKYSLETHIYSNEEDFKSEKVQTLRFKRDIASNTTLREPYNANDQSRFIEVVFVIDNRKYQELHNSTEKVEQYCKDVVNVVNGLFSSLNIFVALVDVVIWRERDEITTSEDGDLTLKNFLEYRRKKLLLEHPNDYAQLITKQQFKNKVIGKALIKTICTTQYSGGVTTDIHPEIPIMGSAVAHTIGHILGMQHDNNNCDCPEDKCIMTSSYSSVPVTKWSSCSRNDLKLSFAKGLDHCLKNKPRSIFGGPVCGNGFVEEGEQCDCGLPEFCDNKCCIATTCMLKDDATCATGNCCNLETCRFKPPGRVCRSATNECDLPEYCTGTSEYCPGNFYKLDGEICKNGNARCYEGRCGNRAEQCNLLWGKYSHPGIQGCFNLNIKGTRIGNCGYNFITNSFTKCDEEDILCGRLYCQNANDELQYGLENTAILSQAFVAFNGSILPCRNAIVDVGLNSVDPGLVPNGAQCGKGKMCVNQKCVTVDSVQKTRTCPNNCYNNGYCNNLGHCHCDIGYVLPDCRHLAPGGSVDSGPAHLYTENIFL